MVILLFGLQKQSFKHKYGMLSNMNIYLSSLIQCSCFGASEKSVREKSGRLRSGMFFLRFLYIAFSTQGFNHGLSKSVRSPKSLWSVNPSCPVADELNGWSTDIGSEFLEKYWQKRPVLIRNAFPLISHDVEFLSKSDMFSLSYDEDVESRILEKDAYGEWQKLYGPFEPKSVRKYDRNWTILVQEVDRHIPRMADMWGKYFDFIPSWRRDDIMVSYAAPGGGIGAHVDSYDVFLIQGR